MNLDRLRTRCLWLVSMCCMLATPAWAQQTSSEATQTPSTQEDPMRLARRQVGALLKGHHHLPTSEQIERTSPLARAALEELVRDEALFLLYRRRALHALVTTWPDEANRNLLDAIVHREDDALVLVSLNLLATHYGEHGQDMIEATLLRSPYPTHKMAALHALSSLPRDVQLDLVRSARDTTHDDELDAMLAIKADELGSAKAPSH